MKTKTTQNIVLCVLFINCLLLLSCKKNEVTMKENEASINNHLSNSQIITITKKIGTEHNKILLDILQNVKKNGIIQKASSHISVNSKAQSEIHKLNTIDADTYQYLVDNTIEEAYLLHPEFSDPLFQITPTYFGTYMYTYNIATSDLTNVIQAYENNNDLITSSTFNNMVYDIHNMIYTISDIPQLQTQLAQYRDNNISLLVDDAEKIALSGGINVAIASLDFWNANYDEWITVFGGASSGTALNRIKQKVNGIELIKKTNVVSDATLKGIVMGDAYGAMKGMIRGALRGSAFGIQSAAVGALAGGLIQGVIYSAEGGLIGAFVDWLW